MPAFPPKVAGFIHAIENCGRNGGGADVSTLSKNACFINRLRGGEEGRGGEGRGEDEEREGEKEWWRRG